MKTRITIALAALAATAAMVGVSAAAEEGRRLARNADDFSFLQMQTGAMASMIGSPRLAQSHAVEQQVLEQSAMRPAGVSALTAAAPLDRPVIAPDSLVGSDRRAMLSRTDDQATGSGFAAIRAASQGRSETNNAQSSPEGSASPYRYAPPK